MPDRKSIYTLNKKDPEAIVYTDADKHIIRLTRADFDTEADFLKWKAWSDDDYHEEDKSDNVQASHTLPLECVSDGATATVGPEIIIEERFEKLEYEQFVAETVIRIRWQLTGRQFYRLWMNAVDEMKVGEIAKEHGVKHSAVSGSISTAKKKILKYFEKHPTERPW